MLASRGDWQQAAFQLQKAAQLDPSVASTHADCASVLTQLGRLTEAEREARVAVEAAPRSPQAHDLLGRLLAQRGQTMLASSEFDVALKIDPTFASAEIDLALILLQGGNRGDALRHLQHAGQSSDKETAERARNILEQISVR